MDRRPDEGSHAAMPKQYRDAHSTADQVLLLPPSLHDWLPDDHAAYFVLDVVEQLDLSPIERRIQSKDPRADARGALGSPCL